MKSCQMYRFIPIMLLCVCLFTGGCSQNKDQPSATHNQTPATEAASHTDHTPQVLTPQADGTKTFTTDTAVIDISHTQEGYIMAKYTGSNAKPKLQLTGTDGITYTYSLYKDYSPFPLLPEMEPIRSVSTKMFPMTVTQRCSPRHFLLHLQIR